MMRAELLDIRFAGTTAASALHLCSPGEQLTWNGNTYVPMNMTRGLVEEVLSTQAGDVPSVNMLISNINLQMAALLNTNELEGAEATLRVVDRRLLDNPNDAIVLTVGEIRGAQLTEAALSFEIVPVLGMMAQLIVPRRQFQQSCPYTFGSRACLGATPLFNLAANPYSVSTTALSGSTDSYIRLPAQALTDAGSPANPNAVWEDAVVFFTSGNLTSQQRPAQRYQVVAGQRRLYLRYPFLQAPAPGDALIIRMQCSKTLLGDRSCSTFGPAPNGNAFNFGGFTTAPYGQAIPTLISG